MSDIELRSMNCTTIIAIIYSWITTKMLLVLYRICYVLVGFFVDTWTWDCRTRQYASTCSKLFARRWLAAAIEKNAISTKTQGESLHGNLLILVGLMASWASWAFFTFFKYFLVSSETYLWPYLNKILINKRNTCKKPYLYHHDTKS